MPHVHKSSFEPAPFLVENAGLLPKGRVLDVAMGNGRNAIYLARMGFEVEGVDVSTEAIGQALIAAQEAGVSIKAVVADLEKDYHIPQNTHDVIICFNYLQRSLIPAMKQGAKARRHPRLRDLPHRPGAVGQAQEPGLPSQTQRASRPFPRLPPPALPGGYLREQGR